MCVSVVTVRAIVGELRNRQIDPAPFLAEAGVDTHQLTDLRNVVESEVLERLVRRAYEVTREPALGLMLGASAPQSALQIVGPLMLSCSTLREAIQLFQRYARLFVTGVRWSLREQGDTARFTYGVGLPAGDTSRFFTEYVGALAIRVGTHFHESAKARATEVTFKHADPGYAALYESVFRCPVRFGAEDNSITFPRARLDLEQVHGDSMLRAMLVDSAERLLREREDKSTVERVRTLLRYRRDLSELDATTIAQAIGLSPRALRRRLGIEGVSVTSLLDEARLRIACEDLKRPDSSIKEIAERLGFSEASAFHRAFKRWTGVTPAQYSRQTA
jgi:AraC-like DNA-binding protein